MIVLPQPPNPEPDRPSRYDPLRCWMCKFYFTRKDQPEGTGECYGLPPNPTRPIVGKNDPRCSLFVTHPDMLMERERETLRRYERDRLRGEHE